MAPGPESTRESVLSPSRMFLGCLRGRTCHSWPQCGPGTPEPALPWYLVVSVVPESRSPILAGPQGPQTAPPHPWSGVPWLLKARRTQRPYPEWTWDAILSPTPTYGSPLGNFSQSILRRVFKLIHSLLTSIQIFTVGFPTHFWHVLSSIFYHS